MDEDANEALYQNWKHAREEDTPTEQVFRPPSADPQRTRGYFSFELRRDGTARFQGIGPTDRVQTASGAWKKDGAHLTLYTDPGGAPDQVLDIVSVTPDKLVVKK